MFMTHAKRNARSIMPVGVEIHEPGSRRGPLSDVALRARDLGSRTQARALGALDRRRGSAAETLETLARALRRSDPLRAARTRRKTLAVAGGASLALTAALGVGVALGMMLSRRLQRRAEARTTSGADKPAQSLPQAMGEDPVTAGLDL